MKYYNFCLFHFIKRNFVAQTGDPSGTGSGGESIFKNLYGHAGKYFEAEQSPKIRHTRQGLLSMTNNGNNYHGSQFMITLASSLDSLDGKHSVFGSVIEEDFLTLSLLNDTMTGDDGIPYRDVRILHTWVTEDPFDELPGLEYPPQSPTENEASRVDTGRIRYDEDIDAPTKLTKEEIERQTEDHEGIINAEILTMVGDIPSSDVKPPENVLFVCKLNPLTSDEDLEIVFSRFGKILSCEVIRDWKTRESLQYAFIEFENVSSCEEAYFKMDNVLIDDRRIHVDFSQSVSKLVDAWKQSKGGMETPNPAMDVKAREKELLALSEEFTLNTRHERFKTDDFIFKNSEDIEESPRRQIKVENIKQEIDSPEHYVREREISSHRRRDDHHKRRESHSRKDSRRGEHRGRESRHRHVKREAELPRQYGKSGRTDRCSKHRDSSRNCKKMAKCEECIRLRGMH